MRQVKLWMLAAILIICGMSWMTSCTDNTDNPSGGADYRTTLFVATDRHEVGKGNNLTAMLARAVAGSGIRPQTVLLGGDYDMMELRRYSLDADQPDRQFGLTGKPNPYVITFPTRNN